MTFTSISFLSIFFPLSFFLVWVSGRRLANLTLLLLSLCFYIIADVNGLVFLLASIIWNYVVGVIIGSYAEKRKALILALGVGGNLLLLCYIKYAAFFLDIIGGVPLQGDSPINNSLPVYQVLGISFFTFQAISYLTDIYRKSITHERNFIRFALYLTIFPHLVAGPIIRYGDICKQLVSRCISMENVANGLRRFVQGLAKKVLLANLLAATADQIFSLPVDQLNPSTAWFGAFLYTLQIYYDFSGYTDMAIGLGLVFGFRFPENFNYPYVATSIRDFWRRWHMTLSSWFRDYLYIPLGGGRCSSIRIYFNLVLVFVLCGLWHGASWNFLVWGGIHGFFIVAERMGLEKLLARGPRALKHIYLLLVVVVSWVVFRNENIVEAWRYINSMIVSSSSNINAYPVTFFLNMEMWIVLVCGILLAFPWWRGLFARDTVWEAVVLNVKVMKFGVVVRDMVLLLLLVISLMEVASGVHNPFIYQKF